MDSKVQKDPLARAKRMTIVEKTEITHIFDYESAEPVHAQQFNTTLERMKLAQDSGKNIKYQLGYSNFTFELWVILHKADCNGHLTYRRQYLEYLNRAYGENFEDLNKYKNENNFKRILSSLTLTDVREAIRRSEVILQTNKDNGYVIQRYKGYEYYRENPSLSIEKTIAKILSDCQLM